jgi:hypothetical protein
MLIYTECYADTELIKSLGFSKKQYIHRPNKPKIGYHLVNGKIKDVLAIVDEDPFPNKTSHRIFNRFETLKRFSKERLVLKKYKTFYIIELCPDLEGWLLHIAKQSKFNLADFIDPAYLKSSRALHDFTATANIPAKFTKCINSMLENEVEGMMRLKELIDNRDKLNHYAQNPI